MAAPRKIILKSSEVRWFFENDIPKEWKRWLQAMGSFPLASEERTDYYLKTNRTDYGVKFRSYDGKQNLEFKFLEGNSKSIDNPAPAKIENWVKWSLPLPEEFNEDVGKNPAWIEVRKIRYLVKIGFDHEEPGFYSADAMPKNGCGVEITALELPNRQPCWTFGYEAFGDDDKALSNLRRGVQLSLKGLPADVVKWNRPASYAKWLSSFND